VIICIFYAQIKTHFVRATCDNVILWYTMFCVMRNSHLLFIILYSGRYIYIYIYIIFIFTRNMLTLCRAFLSFKYSGGNYIIINGYTRIKFYDYTYLPTEVTSFHRVGKWNIQVIDSVLVEFRKLFIIVSLSSETK